MLDSSFQSGIVDATTIKERMMHRVMPNGEKRNHRQWWWQVAPAE
jgi:hypothetical protein